LCKRVCAGVIRTAGRRAGRSTTHLLRAGGVEASSPPFPNMIPTGLGFKKNGFKGLFDSLMADKGIVVCDEWQVLRSAAGEAGRAVARALVCVRVVRRSRGGACGRPVDRVTIVE